MKLLFAGIAAIFLPVHISARAEDAPGAPALQAIVKQGARRHDGPAAGRPRLAGRLAAPLRKCA
jgi:hypothetical protein